MEIKGLEELEVKIQKLQRESPDDFMDAINKGVKFMRKKCKENTPVGPQKKKARERLVNNYKIEKANPIGGVYYAEVRNRAPHAHLVEEGHNQVILHKDGTKETVGFVPGRYYAKKAYEENKGESVNIIEKAIDKALDKVR